MVLEGLTIMGITWLVSAAEIEIANAAYYAVLLSSAVVICREKKRAACVALKLAVRVLPSREAVTQR